MVNMDYLCRLQRHGGMRLGYKKNVYHALTMITQFGINMLVPIFLCSFLGIYMDRKLGTSFWMVFLFLWEPWPVSAMYMCLQEGFTA